MIRKVLLAGASALAVAATAANATTYSTPGSYTWTAPSNGVYEIDIWGAGGGASSNGSFNGGLGAGVWTKQGFNAGDKLYVFVGQQGSVGGHGGGGGGGGSAVLFYPDKAFNPYFAAGIAGGGGGAGPAGTGGDGQHLGATVKGGDGLGDYGFGLGGTGWHSGQYGFAADRRPAGPGGGGYGIPQVGYAGKNFYSGGYAGLGKSGSGYFGYGHGYYGGAGGWGFAGGGGGYVAGGGGGGYAGGGAGGLFNNPAGQGLLGAGGGGGGSSVDTSDPNFGYGDLAGGRSGNGLVDISLAAVPEPEEWMLLLMGVFSVGYLLRRQRDRLVGSGAI
jgi:hypothetical protein